MRRLVVAGGVALAVAASLLPPRLTAVTMPAFAWHAAVGGGVTEVPTGRRLDPAPERDSIAATSVTVLPYRRGARYRIPVMLNLEQGARDVLVTDVRVVTGRDSVARPAGAVYTLQCCGLIDTAPFAPFRLGVREPGRPRHTTVAMVGLDVELCCAPPPPGWVEVLPGLAVTYRRHGVTRTVLVPLPAVQSVVIRS